MPDVGEIKRGNKIGKSPSHKYIWATCFKCKEGHWFVYNGKSDKRICAPCNKKDNKFNLGNRYGRYHYKNYGYSIIKLNPTDTYFPMADINHFVREHRYVMAKHLGRCLSPQEMVHHINGVRDDNRIENLELISPANHALRTTFCNHCELKKEIKLLQWQNKELLEQIKILNMNLLGYKIDTNG